MKHSPTRRDFLKTSQPALLAGIAPNIASSKTPDRKPPNVLFIICDQMRGDAMGCVNHPNVRTPNLDRLAKEGVLFQNGFCPSPVCVPSRMATFSGTFPHQTGQLSNRPWSNPKLSMENTLVDLFLRNGYRTGWVGKNHTYTKDALSKMDYVSLRAREPFRKYSRFVPPHWHSDTLWPEEKCHPRKNTDEAIKFIQDSKQNEPFFLHVSYFDPHPPYMAPAEYTSNYCSKDMKLKDTVSPNKLSDRLAQFADQFRMDQVNEADMRETFRYYYASIEWGVDYQVGRLLNELEKQGLRDDTIVVFTSDHGDFMGDYHLVRKGMFFYDSLLHVPMIWSAPKHIAKGKKVTNLAYGLDIFPTLADLMGQSPSEHLEGRSLKSILQRESQSTKEEFLFASAGYGHVEPVNNPSIDSSDKDDTPLHTRVMEQSMEPTYKTKMIRTHDWKFILNEADPPELYSMKKGKERENVAEKKEYASIRKNLEKRLEPFWKW